MNTSPPEPSRETIAEIMNRVITGRMTREEASAWALQWVAAKDPGVDDRAAWEALVLLGGVDLRHGAEEPFLYPPEQIEEWRDALLNEAN